MQYVVFVCTHALLFVMKAFTQQYLISQKEYMNVLLKTELPIRRLVVAIFTNFCNIKKLLGYLVYLYDPYKTIIVCLNSVSSSSVFSVYWELNFNLFKRLNFTYVF